MKRKIIKIDEEKCTGCGLCVSACHEGAIGMVNGKAKLLRDDYCDGLGDCLPACPVDAISFEKREAAAYNEEEVKKNMAKKSVLARRGCSGSAVKMFNGQKENKLPCGCPYSNTKTLESFVKEQNAYSGDNNKGSENPSRLRQWPVQIKLVPVNAPYFENADLLIAADCAAYACGDFHGRYMENKITVIGCPKLDNGEYTEKLAEIIKNNSIKSVTVIRMEVPCCSAIAIMAREAVLLSGKDITIKIVTLGLDGKEI